MSDIVLQFEGTVYENGYGQVAKKVMRDRSIHAVAKAIYAYLVSFAGRDGTAFPGVSLMVSELGIKSKDTYYKYRNQLEKAGYIRIEQNPSSNGKFTNNIYHITAVPQSQNLAMTGKKPFPKFSTTVKRDTEKPYTVNQDTNNINPNNNNLNNISNTHTEESKKPVCVVDPTINNLSFAPSS